MSISDLQIMFWFGLALILTGLVLLPFNFSGGGMSRIKLPAIEMELNGPALFVMFLGAGLMWFSISKRETDLPPAPAAIAPPPSAVATVSPTPAPTPAPAPAPPSPESSAAPTGEKGFGVVLIASSAPSTANQQAIKAKGLAPPDADIILYRRKSAWAVVIHYADSLTAEEDLLKYRADRNWASAYLVNLGTWCPLAKPTTVPLPSGEQPIAGFDCRLK
ncbi:hypothetical protein F7D13_00605 [Methylocystis rosea]|uniref:SPOR domain-containing protein n=1 Tax=Methylocystis rosea TaxID=173366 RepID=A0ABX6EDU5_9HYPH|nr:hypothetical protein [Methylocystis rosea]QGM92649.1 hypothetical protein F7D13_00605 [Methylocystis rosea]